MNKSVIKTFAINARKKLLEQVKQKAFQIEITAKSITELKQEAGYVILNNVPQEKGFKEQRDKLVQEIEQKGYDQVMEEVAYTWFNRFIALRFMEVNNYLPTGVRVLSSLDSQKTEPDIIREALNVDLPLDREKIYNFQDRNDTEGLFKYLLIHQCNELNKILPFMFEKIADYTELLFPSHLLQEGSVIRELVSSIKEEDCQEVEIIGWLYQYYISEKKDEVFADLKRNKKITKENIPAATQLFTPKWIVQYMVENSLGRLWLESHPNDELKAQWKYYLEEAEQEPEVQKQLDELKNPNLNPLEIKVLDPCCGSGHILVYAFEVLYEIYKSYGYMEEDIPKLILENNLFGLDIDDRAAQLASFAVMMKARQKSSGIFREDIRLNICAIQESNWMNSEVREILVDREAIELEEFRQRDIIQYLADIFKDAKEYGSILNIKKLDLQFLEKRLNEIQNSVARDLMELPYREIISEKLIGIMLQAKNMGAKYDVVCTNPPYMGNRGMNPILASYVERNFADSKSDLFAVFIECSFRYLKRDGFCAMVTMHSWMFLEAYLKLRKSILSNHGIYSILHLGMEAFENIIGKVVQTAAFIIRNTKLIEIRPVCVRLVDFYDSRKYEKEKQFFNSINLFNKIKQVDFDRIPSSPIAYWVSENILNTFTKGQSISDYADFTGSQNKTADNEYYLKFIWEVDSNKVGINKKWVFYIKGGKRRKYYGNIELLVNWSEEARLFYKTNATSNLLSPKFWYQEGITYTSLSNIENSFRYLPRECIFDIKGPSITNVEYLYYFLGLFNCKIPNIYFNLFNSTVTLQVKDVKNFPCIVDKDSISSVEKLARENVDISRTDWDNSETSWDFRFHPILVNKKNHFTIAQAFTSYSESAETQFNQLKSNEEELNCIFIEIYGLQDELTSEVQDKDITIRKADRERDIKSFISYAVGCMLGRYSLDEEGLIFAGGKFDPSRYKTFKADTDGILSVLDNAYFEDDIVSRFVEFVKVTFGEDTLATNLDYIAETLGRKTNESSRDCIRRYFLKDFYKDHVQTYKKRPIYWLFTSGKEQGFNALIYMHRYDSSTVSRVRTDYLHPLQNKLEAEYQRLSGIIASDDSQAEKNKATKRLKELTKQMEELKKYDGVIHNLADQQIEIDLDDGVVVNYAKFEKVLAKIQ